MRSRVKSRELEELKMDYEEIRKFYFGLSPEERERLDPELRKNIELLIKVLEG